MADSTAPPDRYQRLLRIAERDPRRGVVLAHQILAQTSYESPGYAWASYTLGSTLLCWERTADARPYLLNAQTLFSTQNQCGELACRYALLRADIWLTDSADLADSFAGMAELFDSAGMQLEAAHARLDQARMLLKYGHVQAAMILLDAIQPLLNTTRIDRAHWLRAAAGAALQQDDYPGAAVFLAESQAASAGYLPDLARCALDLGWLERRRENLETALTHYRAAERMFTRLDLPIRQAFCAMNLGGTLSMRGDYDAALVALLRAMHTFTALGRQGEVGFCLIHIGNIHYYTRRWEAAQACYTRAESLCIARGLVAEHLMARRNQAMVAQASGEREYAVELLNSVVAAAESAGLRAEVAEATAVQASIWLDMGNLAAAATTYALARTQFHTLGNAGGAAECDLESGWIALRQGDTSTALAHIRNAAPALAHHRHHAWRVAYALARCAEAHGDTTTALEHYHAAMTIVATLRKLLASEDVSSRIARQAAALRVDAVRLAVRLGDAEALLSMNEAQRALVLQRLIHAPTIIAPELQPEHDALQAQISQARNQGNHHALDTLLTIYADFLIRAHHSTSPGRIDVLPDTAFDLARFREHMIASFGSDWTVLVYIQDISDLLVVSITPESATIHAITNDQTLARMLIHATDPHYQTFTYRVQGQQPGEPWANLRQLAKRLVPEAIRARLHPDHRLLIVPTGQLHALPWGALRLDTAWLAEQAIIQILPSLAVGQFLLRQKAPAGRPALLIGCSTFGEREVYLPGTMAELESVATHWPEPAVIWAEAAATREALLGAGARGELAKYGVLHMTTHARLLPQRGLSAHLALWDGDVLLPEITHLQLDRAMVVLSACEGATPDPLDGEEVLSLGWALLAGGAAGVIASLWRTYEVPARALMETFYSDLAKHGDAGRALAYAQRTRINLYKETRNPGAELHHWCAMLLIGDLH